jgi:hypothetical protein
MTPKERWLATLQRRTPDRVAMDYWALPEVDQKLLRHFRYDDICDVFRSLHIDRPVVAPTYVGPPRPKNANDFGVIFGKALYSGGNTNGFSAALRRYSVRSLMFQWARTSEPRTTACAP